MKLRYLLLFLFLPLITLIAQDSSQTFLSVSRTGVEEFINSHPEYDGRGVIIFVLDTGVDMGIEGLQKTSTGAVKVIDVQDFTGEGNIKLYDCETDEENGRTYFINEDQKYKVAGADSLSLKSVNDKYYIGALKESKFLNSSSHAEDLNGNGSTDDKYYVVAFLAKDGNDTCWVAYFDANDNGDLSDDKPLRDYKEKFDTFTIPNKEGLPKLTFAINIFPKQKMISLHFDDGAHGTHVSGIAAGYHIGGTYLNGIAPGANIISLKIGNNNFSGGATVTGSMKKAFLYADKVSQEKKEPCVLNMSFGIGSEIEGHAEIEEFLDTLLSKNPYLYVCISNGNDGPGISTAGLPASSNYVLSSGAVLAREVGRDLFGSTLKKDVLFFFSSRGGEVSKPDLCSPGACTSTVPNWEQRDVMGGTSMASPYTAGVTALLLSAMQKEYPDVKIPSQLLFEALRNSATKMPGYTPIDVGAGYINVVNAYKLLKKYIKNGEVKKFESYTVSAFAAKMPNKRAQNIYIRNGNFLNGNETFTYVIKRNNVQKKDRFYRIYNIKSDADWLKPIQEKTYIRNKQRAYIRVKIDKEKLNSPGLYVGKITATRNDKSAMPEFSMLATVVIPYEFNSSNNYSHEWASDTVEPGMIKRYFIDLPAGQTGMNISLSSIKERYARNRFWLFAPDGSNLYVSHGLDSQNNDQIVEKNFYNLKPGVYELDVEGSFFADKLSNYDLSVNFSGIDRTGQGCLDSLNNKIKVVNVFNRVGSYDLSGKILGYENESNVTLKGAEHYSLPFVMTQDESYKEFTIELSRKDFNKITDFSMLIYNKKGKAIAKSALSYKEGKIKIENTFQADSVNLRLVLVPAFVDTTGQMTISLNESTYWEIPQFISVKDNYRAETTLYPSISRTLKCSFNKPVDIISKDSKYFGKIYFESNATKKIEYELPINVKF